MFVVKNFRLQGFFITVPNLSLRWLDPGGLDTQKPRDEPSQRSLVLTFRSVFVRTAQLDCPNDEDFLAKLFGVRQAFNVSNCELQHIPTASLYLPATLLPVDTSQFSDLPIL